MEKIDLIISLILTGLFILLILVVLFSNPYNTTGIIN